MRSPGARVTSSPPPAAGHRTDRWSWRERCPSLVGRAPGHRATDARAGRAAAGCGYASCLISSGVDSVPSDRVGGVRVTVDAVDRPGGAEGLDQPQASTAGADRDSGAACHDDVLSTAIAVSL